MAKTNYEESYLAFPRALDFVNNLSSLESLDIVNCLKNINIINKSRSDHIRPSHLGKLNF